MKDASNLVRIPETMPLELAAMLPCGALAAYAAVQRLKPFISEKLDSTSGLCSGAFPISKGGGETPRTYARIDTYAGIDGGVLCISSSILFTKYSNKQKHVTSVVKVGRH